MRGNYPETRADGRHTVDFTCLVLTSTASYSAALRETTHRVSANTRDVDILAIHEINAITRDIVNSTTPRVPLYGNGSNRRQLAYGIAECVDV
jgi:hypothetical protein